MINAELIAKIKAEIDRLYGEYKDKFHQCGDQYHLGLIDGLDMAERVLDSLESEKPMDLGERIGSYNIVPYIDNKIAKLQDMWREEKVSFDWDDLKDMIEGTARHFAQWGAEQILREVERWVEKNTCRYIDTQNDEEGYITDVFLENAFVDDLKKATKEIFTKWGAEHLKK